MPTRVTRERVFKRIIGIIDHKDLIPTSVKGIIVEYNHRLDADLGMDSLSMVTLLFTIDDAFGIDLPNYTHTQVALLTIGELCDKVLELTT